MRFSEEALTAGPGGGDALLAARPAASASARCSRSRPRARSGWSRSEVLPLAAAIELIHTYSLIHDDLPAMDDDELRRGQPTCHVKFGEDVAILAGDGLYAEAFRHLLTHQRSAPERVLLAAAELAAATGVNGMVGGQYADVERRHARRGGGAAAPARAEDRTSDRCVGALRTTVGRGRGRTADAPFRRFAAELGVLFQIVDDILDVTGTDDALGKPRGSDERHGKRTYVSEFGMERARELAAESHAHGAAALAEVAEHAGRGSRASRAGAASARPPSSSTSPTSSTRAPHDSLLDDDRRPAGPARAVRAGAGDSSPRRCASTSSTRSARSAGTSARTSAPASWRSRCTRCWSRRATRSSGTSATRPTRTRSSPGRRDRLATIRQYGGLAPFCSMRGVRARHHGRRPRVDLDRLRGRHQGGHAPLGAPTDGRQGRRGDRRRRDDRRRGLRGDRPGRRPGHADGRRAQRQRHVDRAERRRAVALLQPRAAEPEAVARARGASRAG